MSEMKEEIKPEVKSEIMAESKPEMRRQIVQPQLIQPQMAQQYQIQQRPQVNTLVMERVIDRGCDNMFNNFSTGRVIFTIFHVIMSLVAIVLSLRCNNKSLDFGSLLVAIFFPYIYIIYILGTKNLKEQCDISL